MTADEMKALIAEEAWDELETAWVEAVEAGADAAELAGVLSALVGADRLDSAETLGWMLLTDRAEKLPPAQALAAARAVVAAVADSDELRTETARLYRAAHGAAEHFDAVLEASGLLGGQTARRALATLDVCLKLAPGAHVVNRLEGRVLRVERFDPAAGQFELTDADGHAVRLDPKALADEFDPADASDFRVIHQHHPERLGELMESDPGAVLTGLCIAHGGRTDSARLKRELAGRHIPPEKWSRWWTRARNAAKRSDRLALEGRNPVEIVYYPGGRRLEDELAADAARARMPLEKLEVLRRYARELRQRKETADASFAGPIVEALAGQARSFRATRPHDALAASLAVAAAAELGLPAPREAHPTAAEVLAEASDPAGAIAAVGNPSLWPLALDALGGRPDAPEQLAALLPAAPADQLDGLVERLVAAGAAAAVDEAAARAVADPAGHLQLCLWLWAGPGRPPADPPGKVDLLGRLLEVLQRVDHDGQAARDLRRDVRQQVRSALSAQDYASYRRAVEEMDQAVAETFKGRIDRCVGLAQTVREEMLAILRERFGALFVRAKVDPWADESVLWTTAEGLGRREAALKEIVEVKMPANARAIGEAAAHGDLSENSEWKFAIEERDLLRARAGKLQDELARARVLTAEDVPEGTVGIGSRVRLRRTADGEAVELTFLGAWDGEPERNVFSYQTPLAGACMGKAVGDAVTLKIGGAEAEYRIEDVASALE